MTKFFAKCKLESAIKNRDHDGVLEVFDWAKCNLSARAFTVMFVKDIDRYPDGDRQWFRDNFPISFATQAGKVFQVVY
jgi:hypothetical protein